MLRVFWVHGCEPGRVSDGSRLALCQTLSIECPLFDDDSTTVSSAWELTSVSMHYSQGNGVHTLLSRACTAHPRSVSKCVCLYTSSVSSVLWITCVYPRHGYVLYG